MKFVVAFLLTAAVAVPAVANPKFRPGTTQKDQYQMSRGECRTGAATRQNPDWRRCFQNATGNGG